MSFEIITDSPSANLPIEMIEKYRLHVISLILRDGEKSGYSFENGHPIDPVPYYRRMRDENAAFTTSCINVSEALEQIEPLVRAGSDVLYLGFSSGLSATSHNVLMALDELRERYPERKIMGCDTLAAAMGEGLIVALAAENARAARRLRKRTPGLRKTSSIPATGSPWNRSNICAAAVASRPRAPLWAVCST